MKRAKRIICALMTGFMLASPVMGNGAVIYAREYCDQQTEFIPESFTIEELEEIVNGKLNLAIHMRDNTGKWSVRQVEGDLMTLQGGTKTSETTGVVYVNTDVYDGIVSYSGPFNGDKEAEPINESYWSKGIENKRIGDSLAYDVVYKDGKWRLASQSSVVDVWYACTPSFDELKTAEIRFQSNSTEKTYDVGLIKDSYTITALNESADGTASAHGTIQTKPYVKALQKLTNKKVTFGGMAEEIGGGEQMHYQRCVMFEKDKDGMWHQIVQGFDESGVQDDSKKGIVFRDHQDVALTGTFDMYRLYNPNSSEHFYTADQNEKEYLIKAGWKDEGIAWKAPEISSTPVYRLYNKNAGDHHYTIDENERDYLVKIGWTFEKIGWYSDDERGVSIYRQYNPNAKAGSHNYTANRLENDHLVNLGWTAEGISWYGVDE